MITDCGDLNAVRPNNLKYSHPFVGLEFSPINYDLGQFGNPLFAYALITTCVVQIVQILFQIMQFG